MRLDAAVRHARLASGVGMGMLRAWRVRRVKMVEGAWRVVWTAGDGGRGVCIYSCAHELFQFSGKYLAMPMGWGGFAREHK